MFVQNARILGCARWLTCLGALVIIGCGNDGGSLSTLGSSVIEAASEDPYYESQSNDFLQTAEVVDLDDELQAIQGSITGPGDVDTYNLGPVQAGDRIVVEVSTEPGLNGAVALFDDAGAVLLVNDHRNVYLGRSDPFIDVVINRPSSACYVAMAATPGYRADDDYTLLAYKDPSQELPEPRPDVILLVFDGGNNVRIGSRPSVDVPVFDAANIDPVYAGRTSTMIEHVVAGVREDFIGLDVTILSTSEGAVYDGDMSRVFFGTYDEALLGVAENVDEFNSKQRQEAIIFTDTFAAFMTLNPSVAEMGQAIANVAAH
ncbi:MAG: hypothetical protein KJ749_00615 [Planctomycetes bacterium]|nr:hypothetical protein [Planctomycetota bacterium]